MALPQDDDDERFLLPQNVGLDTEDVEMYRPGGFHPVHLGDTLDDGPARYKIVHKLGSGGFSTVWLARDEHVFQSKCVALKISTANQWRVIRDKQDAISILYGSGALGNITGYRRMFTFEGPNGVHLCLVLPVLGPSASDLSQGLDCRLRPWLARKVGYEVAKALAKLHSHGLCHGDVTTDNILFGLSDFDRLEESDIYDLFGPPATGKLKTESGEPTGLEAPRYIVKALDFLSSNSNIITHDIKLIDFDQCFPASSPPNKMLATPYESLAPEAAAGFPASPASDIWALGCCLFGLRSGEGPFENSYQVTSPVDLLRYIILTLGDMPSEWQEILWDEDGMPTRDPSAGNPLEKLESMERRPLKDLVRKIWDEPEGRVVHTGTASSLEDDGKVDYWGERIPYAACFEDMVWKPKAVRVDNTYMHGYNDEVRALSKELPQIPEHEADLLFDLLSKIFVYEPERRPTAEEVLGRPWFHMDGGSDVRV
ncbi:Protein kinase-like domain containing protein [Rhypophila sp. PSN 637]